MRIRQRRKIDIEENKWIYNVEQANEISEYRKRGKGEGSTCKS